MRACKSWNAKQKHKKTRSTNMAMQQGTFRKSEAGGQQSTLLDICYWAPSEELAAKQTR